MLALHRVLAVVPVLLVACARPAADTGGGTAGGTDPQVEPADRQPLRVATFNAHWLWSAYGGGEEPRNAVDYAMVGDLVEDFGLELLGLQEVDGAAALALLDLELDYAWATGSSGYNQNVGLLWRDDLVSVTNVREVQLPSFRDGDKKPLVADVVSRIGDLAFTAVVVHHRPYEDADSAARRARQTQELHTWVAESLQLTTGGPFVDHVVLLGDFNDTFDGINRDVPSLGPFVDDPTYVFATAYSPNYTHIGFESQIDHIVLNTGIEARWDGRRTAEGVHVIPHEQTAPWSNYAGGFADPWPTISDHRPVWVGLSHKAPAP